MVLVTELTKALGIRIPVVQGGMQWVGLPVMAAVGRMRALMSTVN